MAGKLSDEIMKDLAKRRGKSAEPADTGDDEGASDAGDEGEGDEYGGDEATAMEDFKNAESPEDMAAALKAFMKICYPQLKAKSE